MAEGEGRRYGVVGGRGKGENEEVLKCSCSTFFTLLQPLSIGPIVFALVLYTCCMYTRGKGEWKIRWMG